METLIKVLQHYSGEIYSFLYKNQIPIDPDETCDMAGDLGDIHIISTGLGPYFRIKATNGATLVAGIDDDGIFYMQRTGR